MGEPLRVRLNDPRADYSQDVDCAPQRRRLLWPVVVDHDVGAQGRGDVLSVGIFLALFWFATGS